jgi:hypothetical protein
VRPLAIDLFCGLGGWTDGLLAEGYDVIGFDIERHEYGDEKYPAQLVLQDVLTIHGSQFKDAALIVASPPCQEYSYMAMPWSKAKELRRQYLSGERDQAQLTALFDACFRIQGEAIEAAGRHIPLVVENVRGAQEWVGRSRWNFGSFHLWGDVPALMPIAGRAIKAGGDWFGSGENCSPMRRVSSGSKQNEGVKVGKINLSDVGFNVAAARSVAQRMKGVKIQRSESDKKAHIGAARKYASAKIAKIPFVLSQYIARTYKPIAAGCAA